MSIELRPFGVLRLCTEEADDEADDAVERSGEEATSNSMILPPSLNFSSCLSLRLGLKLLQGGVKSNPSSPRLRVGVILTDPEPAKVIPTHFS